MAKHIRPTTKRRRILGVPVFGWLLSLLGGGIALAAWLVLSGVSANITAANFDINWTGTPTIVSGNCTATVVNGDDLNVVWNAPLGGDTCTISAGVKSPLVGGNNVEVQAQTFNAPAGVIATLGAWCGPGSSYSQNQTGTQTLQFQLEIDAATTSPGDSFVFDSATHGVEWVPASQFQAGSCA